MEGVDSSPSGDNLSSTTTILSFETSPQKESRKYFGFSPRQLIFLFTYGLYNIFRGALVLNIGPFYPPEAEKRDVSTTTVGFVIGAYDFATFLTALIFGKFLIPRLGAHRVITFTTFNSSICAILFGCVGYFDDRATFLGLSFFVRLVAGGGDAGFYPSAFTVFAYEFPNLVSTTVGLFEVFFGIGAIFGPIVCAPLVDSIGFEWTYFILGGCLLLSSILILLITPEPRVKISDSKTSTDLTYGLLQLLKLPPIYYAILSLFSTAASIGFITGTLENHLDQFKLTTVQVSAVFSTTTAIYTICSPLWGQVSDRLGISKVPIIASGSVLIIIGFAFLGPLDFISEDHLLWSTLVGLCLHGIGIGSAIMVFFPYAAESAITKGFPDTTSTYGLVSSLFTLTFSLGNAFGPALSGSLYDAVGFKDATLAVIGLSSLVIISAAVLLIVSRKR